jgi:hypothetical protein
MLLRVPSFSKFKEQSSKFRDKYQIAKFKKKKQNPNNSIAAGDATFELCSLNFGLCFLWAKLLFANKK